MRIRRLRILGTATALAAVAALLGVVLYALPPNAAPSVNRIADYVVLNDALFRVHDRPGLARLAGFRDTDRENDRLRFVAIDEGSLRTPPDGLGAWPWPRSVHGRLLQRLAKAGATVATYDVLFLEPSADRAQDAALASGLRAQPTVLGFTATTTGGNDPRLGTCGACRRGWTSR
jgi:CHASE2 domain-containing sensor protein